MFETKQAVLAEERPVVLSLMVQAEMKQDDRKQSYFEILVRHLLNRLLSSESLSASDEAPTRVAQAAYAVALPGVFVSLVFFVMYHQPVPRPFWSQVGDHFLFITYGFVIAGLGTVLQWDLLFPDQLDAFILTTMPIAASRLLLARATALAIFFGGLLIGTNALGIIFFPVAADLHGRWLRHVAAHSIAVLMGGLCISAFLIALQGLFICCLGQRVTRRISPFVQMLCVLVLLAVLFLCPMGPRSIEALLESHYATAGWFPPLWFVGVYEKILWGGTAPALFGSLAVRALAITAAMVLIAVATYPLAYARRTRQVIEGTGVRSGNAWANPLHFLMHKTVLRRTRGRAIYHLTSQTLWRMQRLRLLLAVFGGVALALTIAEVLTVQLGRDGVRFAMSADGIRNAIPMIAFLTVMALRTALRVPVAKAGSWALRFIHGRAKVEHLRAAEMCVMICTATVTLTAFAVLRHFGPVEMRSVPKTIVQVVVAIGLSVLLTDVFFYRERTIAFTEAKPYSMNDLAWVVFIYFFVFPTICSYVVEWEPWIEAKFSHLILALLIIGDAHVMIWRFRLQGIAEDAQRLDMEDDMTLAPGEMGLRG